MKNSGCAIALLVVIFIVIIAVAWPLALALALIYAAFKIYEVIYFRSEKFQTMKDSVAAYVDDCNELNAHIHELEETDVPGTPKRSGGTANLSDVSRWNYKREKLRAQTEATNVYSCSRTVCANAKNDPIKYVCKYFGIKANPESIDAFETLVNNYSAAIDGKKDLEAKRKDITDGMKIPWLIKKLDMKKFEQKIGFAPVGLDEVVFPVYKFQYVSSGGNASMETTVEMNMENLEAMLRYLDGRIKWKKSVAGQRALMTPRLRTEILQRDHYTCQNCGVSTADEPHLLLEVDHIVPVSKGGLTSRDNLQTLCWKCNRSKGAKVE